MFLASQKDMECVRSKAQARIIPISVYFNLVLLSIMLTLAHMPRHGLFLLILSYDVVTQCKFLHNNPDEPNNKQNEELP